MAKALKTNELLIGAALVAGGVFVWSRRTTLFPAVAPAAVLSDTSSSSLPAGTVTPPVVVQPQYAIPASTGVVQTPYGPVYPSNFNPLNSPRAQEIIWRVRMLRNSILDSKVEQAKYPAGHQAINDLQSLINVALTKINNLTNEYKMMAAGAEVPEPADMNAYRAYLKSKGWCDPRNGVPC